MNTFPEIHPFTTAAALIPRRDKIIDLRKGDKPVRKLTPHEIFQATKLLNFIFVSTNEDPESTFSNTALAALTNLRKMLKERVEAMNFIIIKDYIDSDPKNYFPEFHEFKDHFPITATLFDDDGEPYFQIRARSVDAVIEAKDWGMWFAGVTYAETSSGERLP